MIIEIDTEKKTVSARWPEGQRVVMAQEARKILDAQNLLDNWDKPVTTLEEMRKMFQREPGRIEPYTPMPPHFYRHGLGMGDIYCSVGAEAASC